LEAGKLNLRDVPAPCFVIETAQLKENLKTLQQVKEQTGLKILFAQKSFASYAVYPLLARYLDGVCASGLWEARLGSAEFDGEVHTYSPAYREDEIDEIFERSHTVVFNSASQLNRFRNRIVQHRMTTEAGIRINPECSVTETALYDPCAPHSRLGVRLENIDEVDWSLVDGVHFHALCEQTSYALEKVLGSVEERFASTLANVKWLNMGGGHFITSPGYDISHFVDVVRSFNKRHPHLQLYIEPGGAVVLNAGKLVATVLDITPGEPPNAILDISCTCHTPDVLEMPYRPAVTNEVPLDVAPYKYRLGGVSCLAGDQFGVYGFNTELRLGDRIAFLDMAQYSIVKTSMFNGVRHPCIAIHDDETSSLNIVRTFSYQDFRNRL
jgi:carboxynorspermidine decarboxylase